MKNAGVSFEAFSHPDFHYFFHYLNARRAQRKRSRAGVLATQLPLFFRYSKPRGTARRPTGTCSDDGTVQGRTARAVGVIRASKAGPEEEDGISAPRRRDPDAYGRPIRRALPTHPSLHARGDGFVGPNLVHELVTIPLRCEGVAAFGQCLSDEHKVHVVGHHGGQKPFNPPRSPLRAGGILSEHYHVIFALAGSRHGHYRTRQRRGR